MDRIERVSHGELVLHEVVDGRVCAAFTERTGGVSKEPYASLNLGTHVGDDAHAVGENRRRLLEAMGCEQYLDRLIVPNQVHGDHVTVVTSSEDEGLVRVREEIAEGADAIVCTAANVPVMLCYADCVPVVLTAPSGFAVIHSGWKGTYARISAKAFAKLMDATGCSAKDIRAYIGPHIQADSYEVSDELMEKFDSEFGWHEAGKTRNLDMTRAIVQSLTEVGVDPAKIEDTAECTVASNDRYFSYRAENGTTGRHAAVAFME